MQGLLHTILAGANVGILVLASAAFLLRLLQRDGRSELARYTDLVWYVSLGVGTALAVVTTFTGLLGTWSLAAITGTVLAQNKILVVVALLVAFATAWILRRGTGPALWQNARLRAWSAVLMAIGFVNLALAGSMGGSAALKGTVLDPLFIAVGINRYVSLSWGVWLNLAVIALTVMVVLASLRRAR
jgi:hypothetical protein